MGMQWKMCNWKSVKNFPYKLRDEPALLQVHEQFAHTKGVTLGCPTSDKGATILCSFRSNPVFPLC